MTKTNFSLIATTLFIVFLFACGGGDNPKSVADNFLKALNKKDYETAKKYGTEDTRKLLDMISGFSKMATDSDETEHKFKIIGEQIDGTKATVSYKEDDKDEPETLSLIKVDGKWKVAMSKDSMNDEGDDSMDTGATSTDTTSSPADSTNK